MHRDLNVSYPNPMLKEVVCELRFPAVLKIEHGIVDFQDKIREDLPTFGLGERIGFPREKFWEFRNENEDLKVGVRINSLAISSYRYKKFNDFFPELKKYTKIFVETFDISSVLRIGLRYINEYIFETNDAIEEYFRYFVPNFNEERINLAQARAFSLELRKRLEDSDLNLRNDFRKNEQDQYRYILDIDSYVNKKIRWNEVFDKIQALHDIVVKEFHENINNAFIEEVLEKREDE
jgi:uncharacterized protein (TIGR04255 family)